MKNMKTNLKKLTAGAFAGALFLCGFAACETNKGDGNFNITKAQAESIALLHSGVSGNSVTAQNITPEKEADGNYYRVEFVCGNVTYTYRINGDTGDIVKLAVNGQPVDKNDLPAAPASPEANYIGEARAKEIALHHAGYAETDVTELETDFDFDDGMYLYEVEFTYGKSDYEYELIASTGEIYSLEIDDFSVIVPTPADSSVTYISADRAKEIALEDGGVQAENATFKKVKFDKDNGVHIYEIEFVAGGSEYEYELNAVSGAVIESEIDGEKRFPADSAEYIGAGAALQIASAHSGVAENDMRKKEAQLKIKKGVYVYEVEFETRAYAYEYVIDAKTGKILSAEKETND
ncbi:MAG: PepSY domain-containing protein [Candidatus Borkfalkiaceae bacterium]|nr:PepSY domain-containing protein [Christensenellaceae bacterium]